ncbi:MAG TPA: hypothetical protein PLZ51_16320, partial [Aggregatilineales bacterium]|nr:hypothetical protein [Aggregatilineales bacterium]
ILSGHEGEISRAIELSDGRLLSWATDSTMRLWDSQGNPLKTIEAGVTGVRELRDGRLLSWGIDATLHLWDSEG